ncbi:hypothetical protein PINS_up018131 [Pythium insidiosum]|nr:hypothetical protein PINS_up018131 [Pythium insidiosum]
MKDITIANVLSRGSFGDVFLGFYNNDRVAIKRLSAHRRRHEAERTSFLMEAKLMAALHHDRIIQFVGVAWNDPTDVHVVTEFMDGGDLRALLQSFDASGRPVGFDACKVQIALHVIEGLAYLHARQPAVLHRDLKSRNVLLSAATLHAKLVDFGVSRPRTDSAMTTGVGTLRWMAPEVMMGGRYGESADVFSFGVVLSELDTHQIPYHVDGEWLSDSAIVVRVHDGSLKVGFSSVADPDIVNLARDCMAYSATCRPTSTEVVQRLAAIWKLYIEAN